MTVKSLYANIILNKPAVTTPGHITGIIIYLNAWKYEQPSIKALSSNSFGTVLKKEYSNQRVNGWFIATKTIIVVGSIPHIFNWKKGNK